MKKTRLRGLVPIIIYFVALAVLLMIYRKEEVDDIANERLNDIIQVTNQGIADVDAVLSGLTTGLNITGTVMFNMDLEDSKDDIVKAMNAVVDGTESDRVAVCNSEGVGYDNKGKEVLVRDEDFFEEMTKTFANGGSGLLLDREEDGSINKIVVVCSDVFPDGERGYILGNLVIDKLSDDLYEKTVHVETFAIISLNGDVIEYRSEKNGRPEGDELIWNYLPESVSRDVVRQTIVQKKDLIIKAEGYGYVVVVPFTMARGACLCIISEQDMREMIINDLDNVRNTSILIVIISALLVISVIVSERVFEKIESRREAKKETDDELTGLPGRGATFNEIDKYISSSNRSGGLLFVINIDGTGNLRETKGDEYADNEKRAFAEALKDSFRHSDIIGRVENDEFVVFMKDISDEKDIRKQTDEFQVFLYDIKNVGSKKGVSASAGAAIYPRDGRNAIEIVAAATENMKKSQQDGGGRLYF